MLLKGIAAISIAVSACLCCFKLLPGIQWIPITYAPFKRTDVSIQVLATLDAEVVASMKTVQISERVHQIMEDALAADRK